MYVICLDLMIVIFVLSGYVTCLDLMIIIFVLSVFTIIIELVQTFSLLFKVKECDIPNRNIQSVSHIYYSDILQKEIKL